VTFGGRPAPRLADRDAWRQRVACVYQKSTIIPTLTVAENLFLNRYDRGPAGLISWSASRRRAAELLAEWSVDVDPRTSAGDLSVEQRQFVEIARALSFGARFIILDEPTAQLDGAAINRLFGRVRDLQGQGVTFLFISHHLQEVYEICDVVTGRPHRGFRRAGRVEPA
jgi:simple sugar transport system ATP-binding protein